jgi:hypothetical protein
MSWEDIVLTGLRYREDFSRDLAEAAEAAPPHIKEILITLPDLLNLDQDKLQLLKKNTGRCNKYLWLHRNPMCTLSHLVGSTHIFMNIDSYIQHAQPL